MENLLKPRCYKCGKENIILVSVCAPGTYWMCSDCIKKEEEKTKKIATLFCFEGLRFLSPKEYKRKIKKINEAIVNA